MGGGESGRETLIILEGGAESGEYPVNGTFLTLGCFDVSYSEAELGKQNPQV